MIEAHVLARRVGVAVRDPRDVPQPHVVAVHAQQRVGDLILVVELPARAHEHPIVGGGEDPGSRDRVLRVERRGDRLRGQRQLRERGIGDLDVDALLLVGEEIDLVDLRDPEQLRAQPLAPVVQLRGREAIALRGRRCWCRRRRIRR